MVVTPVADVACHVHERLCGESGARAPVSDRHCGRLVADALDFGHGAAPAGEEGKCILNGLLG